MRRAILSGLADAAICALIAAVCAGLALILVPAAMDLLVLSRSLFAFIVFAVALFVVAHLRARRDD
ncbi:hypothetical protein [Nitrobacter sp.]|uniref:hypothetical protein n=1 Tax=Nitrobacter sp. TaxID=29420 RepID=UPI0029CAB591|nr:hypothetical protein [Nitrobacter sp.]